MNRLASNGEIAEPCGVPRSRATSVPSCRCWSCPGLADTGWLCREVLVTVAEFCLVWGEVTDRGVPTPTVVAHLDELEHRRAGGGAGRPHAGADLGLEGGEERLRDGVVVARP